MHNKSPLHKLVDLETITLRFKAHAHYFIDGGKNEITFEIQKLIDEAKALKLPADDKARVIAEMEDFLEFLKLTEKGR